MRFDGTVVQSATPGWAVIMPVKGLSNAKSRIASTLTGPVDELAFAFFKDTMAAALACPLVDRVVVATSDPQVAEWARGRDCAVVSDADQVGINAAARHAARTAAVGLRTAVLVSDLPCLTPTALGLVLSAARTHATAFLTDHQGTGTTIWLADAGSPVACAFGVNSRAEHARRGGFDLVAQQPDRVDWWSARHDIDTSADLSTAIELGVGAWTRAANAESPRPENGGTRKSGK
jgi:2-phospho-L-lactate guanylyltransferase